MNGFINFFKPSGMSSAYALGKIKHKFKGNKCGHMGTLDPQACGVLPVAIGKSTRLFDYLLDKTKIYTANFTFGYETDTLDCDGKIIHEGGVIPTLNEIKNILPKMIGFIDQIPPIYSAKNINGKRSYELARSGKVVELPAKRVEINSIDVFATDKENTFKFIICCKGGTYIRSICRDIAYCLNTFATMTYLCREKSGYFEIENSLSIEDLDKIDNLEDIIISPLKVLNLNKVELTKKQYGDLVNGREVKIDIANGIYEAIYNNTLIAICEKTDTFFKMKTYVEDKGE